MIEGSVDFVSGEKVVGWIGDKIHGGQFDVVVMLDGRKIGEAPATISRPDLALVGFGDGICGFEVTLGPKLSESDLPFITVCPKGSPLSLPRTTLDSYTDAFRALVAKFPHAGRSRSVFGGLWIDRTDALQVLAGRVKVGSCDNAVFSNLRTLIADGLVELPGEGELSAHVAHVFADPRAQDAELSAAATALGTYAFGSKTAALVKTAFDDIPTVYRPSVLTNEPASFAQASSFETLNSPAEMLVGYVLVKGEEVRLDYVFDSHELPEFAAGGVSRWSADAKEAIPVMVSVSHLPVRSVEVKKSSVVIVGPGLIHRVVMFGDAVVLRLVLSPQRASPLRFLDGKVNWLNCSLQGGISGRL